MQNQAVVFFPASNGGVPEFEYMGKIMKAEEFAEATCKQINDMEEANEKLRQEWECTAYEIDDYQGKIEKLKQANRWIPVSERLPEEEDHEHACGHSVHVWVYYGNMGLPERKKLDIPAGYDTDIYHHPTKSWMSGLRPTLWMPIPALPPKPAESV